MATMEQMVAEITGLTQRLALSEQQGVRLATQLDAMRVDTETALRRARDMISELDNKDSRGGDRDRLDLVDIKTMTPQAFGGKAQESYKQWAKKVKAFCNAKKPGFRKALDWAEAEARPVDEAALTVLSWPAAELANAKLYDLLVMHLYDDPLVLVENHQGQGFEAWRSLSRRYDPVGEQFTFDRMTSLLTRERCKDIGELPAALEKWHRDLGLYEKKTGKTLEKEWRVPIIFQMIPMANYSEIKARWQLNKEKDITTFAQELIEYANDLKYDQSRRKGPAPMDLDTKNRKETPR